jgi:hypothetical protein
MKKLSYILITLFFVSFVAIGSASAYSVVNAWNMNLSLLNGQLADGSAISGATDATNVDHVTVTGTATVQQQVSGGVALGNPFTESGFLQMTTFHQEGAQAQGNLPLGNALVYLDYNTITGTLNNDGSVTFNPGSGAVGLYASTNGTLDPTTDFQIATYDILAPSGGSALDFFGGTASNSTVDVTLELTSVFDNNFFTDASNNPLVDGTIFRHLGNVDSLLDPNFNPNPDNSGVVNGNGTSIIHVQNSGQYNIAVVPEPNTLMLLGFGLLGIAGIARKRASKR